MCVLGRAEYQKKDARSSEMKQERHDNIISVIFAPLCVQCSGANPSPSQNHRGLDINMVQQKGGRAPNLCGHTSSYWPLRPSAIPDTEVWLQSITCTTEVLEDLTEGRMN